MRRNPKKCLPIWFPLVLALLILATFVARSAGSRQKDKPDSVSASSLQTFKSKLLEATTRHLNLLLGDDGSVNSLKSKTADRQEALAIYLMFEVTGEQRFRKATLRLTEQVLTDMRATKFGVMPIKEKEKPGGERIIGGGPPALGAYASSMSRNKDSHFSDGEENGCPYSFF